MATDPPKCDIPESQYGDYFNAFLNSNETKSGRDDLQLSEEEQGKFKKSFEDPE